MTTGRINQGAVLYMDTAVGLAPRTETVAHLRREAGLLSNLGRQGTPVPLGAMLLALREHGRTRRLLSYIYIYTPGPRPISIVRISLALA